MISATDPKQGVAPANELAPSDQISNRALWSFFGAFVALTTALASRHVLWRDEVRAFEVATRAASWPDLFRSLHQEGHPVLWYAILRIAYGLTHSPVILPVVSLAIAAGAAFLLLRYAPFPVWARVLAVFGVFLAHEFSVVSRNYGVGVLLMLLACLLFSRRHDRPIRLGLVLALLANTSVHAAFIALILGFVWAMDTLDPAYRRAAIRPASIAGMAIVIAGVIVALMSAQPLPDMAFAFSTSRLQPGKVLRALLIDPGWALGGAGLASVAAAAELPWVRLHLRPDIMTRIITNVVILSIAWSLRRNRACLAAMILATIGFEILFRFVYTGGVRHEGMLAFLLISLCWIACVEPDGRPARVRRRSIALGLLPLLVTQAAGLPFRVRRVLMFPDSSSEAFAKFVQESPRYRQAILAAEPDYYIESMSYYTDNRLFMPRQREFAYRVYFDRGKRRETDFHLGELVNVADSLACATNNTVLLAIGHVHVLADTAGQAPVGYPPSSFHWNSQERARLFAHARHVASFTGSMGDENYHVFEFDPRGSAGCKAVQDTVAAPPAQ